MFIANRMRLLVKMKLEDIFKDSKQSLFPLPFLVVPHSSFFLATADSQSIWKNNYLFILRYGTFKQLHRFHKDVEVRLFRMVNMTTRQICVLLNINLTIN